MACLLDALDVFLQLLPVESALVIVHQEMTYEEKSNLFPCSQQGFHKPPVSQLHAAAGILVLTSKRDRKTKPNQNNDNNKTKTKEKQE